MAKLPDKDKTLQKRITRVVLLGASNLTLAWPRIMDLVQARFAAPLEIYTAQGMGRSYVCDRSAFGIRQLPGILMSELWNALPAKSSGSERSLGLLTDLGNDLLFGREPEEVVQGAEECVRRLRAWDENCQLVMTRPPVASVDTLGWARFGVSRFLLFPLSRLTLQDVKRRTRELDECIQQLGKKLEIPVLQPRAGWYGVDPIHVRRRCQHPAFSAMMDLWPELSEGQPSRANRSRPRAAMRWVFRAEKRTAQPVVSSGGTSVFAY